MRASTRVAIAAAVSGAAAVLVGAALAAWLPPRALVPGCLAAAALAALIAGLAASRPAASVAAASDDLARQLDRLLASGDLDRRAGELQLPELARTARSINRLLDYLVGELRTSIADAERGRAILELAPNGFCVVGSDGRIVYVNAALRDMVDLRGEPEGRRPIEVLPSAEIHEALEGGRANGEDTEIAVTEGDRDLLVRVVPVPDGGAIALVQDVTRFKMAERARTDFVANVSHELRTPVASILGYAETVLGDPSLDAENRSLVETILRNGRRLRDLFEDLLELSKLEARRRELPVMPLPIWPIAEQVSREVEPLARSRGLSVALEGERSAVALGNRESLETVLSNLLRNACAYTPSGGHVVCRVRDLGATVRLSVADDGIGIAPVHQQRIFERFYRVDEGRSRAAGGTGLGLAIVKHLALACGWHVGLESEAGKGSTFWVDLPKGQRGAP